MDVKGTDLSLSPSRDLSLSPLSASDEAIARLRAAAEQSPESAEAQYQLGYSLSIKGDLEEAELHARRAVALDPRHAEAHNNLGYISFRREQLDDAERHYRQATLIKPDYVKAHYNLALAQSLLGRAEESVTGFRRALELDPSLAEAWYNLARVLIGLGRMAEVVDCYRKLLALRPDDTVALQNLGNALALTDQKEEALHCYQKALALQPGKSELHYSLGNVLLDLRHYDEAVASYHRSLALEPQHFEALFAMGNAFTSQNKLADAEAAYRRALEARPDYAEALYNLGAVLSAQGRLEEAIAAYREALRITPDYAEAYCNIGYVLGRLGEVEEAIKSCRRALEYKPDLTQAHSNLVMMMLYTGSYSPEEILAEHRRFAARFEEPLRASWPLHRNRRDPERPLKIGYVSPDFRLHSVSFFIEPILEHHDKARFEITAYHSSAVNDDVTARLRQFVDRWVPCVHLSDAALAEQVRADGIDILVDLSGHTGVNRLLAFARKPAPIEVTYLGYPATTGLSAIDYRLTTQDLDPAGSERWHSEALYRLPRALWCYRREAGAAPPDPPASRNGFVTFGSMNNIFKLSAETIALWSRILHAVPASRLLMTLVPEGRPRELLYGRFAAHGIGRERLMPHAHLAADRFRALASEIDINLDPFPYNGTTTTCEALSMGIPVVTLIGETSVARSGYALLRSTGLEELCAESPLRYLEIATRLAADLARLAELRRTVHARMKTSPVRDEIGLTRDIETAYRDMWRAWCTQRTPPLRTTNSPIS